jgi:hypothetical protein
MTLEIESIFTHKSCVIKLENLISGIPINKINVVVIVKVNCFFPVIPLYHPILPTHNILYQLILLMSFTKYRIDLSVRCLHTSPFSLLV